MASSNFGSKFAGDLRQTGFGASGVFVAAWRARDADGADQLFVGREDRHAAVQRRDVGQQHEAGEAGLGAFGHLHRASARGEGGVSFAEGVLDGVRVDAVIAQHNRRAGVAVDYRDGDFEAVRAAACQAGAGEFKRRVGRNAALGDEARAALREGAASKQKGRNCGGAQGADG